MRGGEASVVHWLSLDLAHKVIPTKNVIPDDPSGWQSRSSRLTVLVAIGPAVPSPHLVHRFAEEPCRRIVRTLPPSSMKV